MRIYKYAFTSDCLTVYMPEGARLLTIREQHGTVAIWALVDPSKPMQRRVFQLIGTGHDVPDDEPTEYVGTAMLNGGALVLHVFEIKLVADAA